MLTVEKPLEHIVVVRMSGVLDAADTKELAKTFNKKLAANNWLGLLMDITEWSDLAHDAFSEDIKLKINLLEKINHFKKIAIISNKQFVTVFSKFMPLLIPAIDIRVFGKEDYGKAFSFVAERPDAPLDRLHPSKPVVRNTPGLKSMVLLLDASRRVIFANQAACDLTLANDGIKLIRNEISLALREDHNKFLQLIAQTLAPGQKSTATPSNTMRAFRPSGKQPYTITATPLFHTSFSLATPPAAVCIIISDPELMPAAPYNQLKTLYKLSPSEAQLTNHLITGSSLRDSAEKLGIGYQTARTQLTSIFNKTQTHRQSELIRLLLTIPFLL